MKVTIDSSAGFCFGVKKAIELAEKEMEKSGPLACLGEIVHNPSEMQRLSQAGLISITGESLKDLKKKKVLFRAHGEPPESFKKAKDLNLEIIDATCTVVSKLQEKIKKAVANAETSKGQVAIFGKKGHPEIIGLLGHSGGKAILITGVDDLHRLDFSRPVELFSQTTANMYDFEKIAEIIYGRMQEFFTKTSIPLKVHNTVCRQVSNRIPLLHKLAEENDIVIFVGGKKSSNGRFLFEECLKINPKSFMVEEEDEINPEWLKGLKKAGLTGATSTPLWLLKKIATNLKNLK